MSFNEFMHRRNRYRNKPVDFKELSEKQPILKTHLIEKKSGGVTLDFRNPEAVRALTIAVAKEDFQLDLELSLDRLIPRIPQKLNYIHWIEDLIERKADAVGIDVGSGCSCIHSLLAVRLNPQWIMYTSEIDPFNYQMAIRNVEKNRLETQIHVKKIDPSALFEGLIDRTGIYDFLMCNPPFYVDQNDCQTRKPDRPSANSVNTAADVESIYEKGGEVGFVKRMIDESRNYALNVRVFTTQLGKKSSLKPTRNYLKDIRFIESELCQGNTMRWVIAWTFDERYKFPENCEIHDASNRQKSKKKQSTRIPVCVPFDAKYSFDLIKEYLEKQLVDELKLESTVLSPFAWIWDAHQNSWSHQRRRRRQKQQQTESETDEEFERPPEKRFCSDSSLTKKICRIQARLDDHKGLCSLYLLFVDGTNSDAANQIGQYIKNQFPNYCREKSLTTD